MKGTLLICFDYLFELPPLMRLLPHMDPENGWCVYCRTWTEVHLRDEDLYPGHNFLGWYCDHCFDWIYVDDEHWRLHARMSMADSSRSHPLSSILLRPARTYTWNALGHTIAEFARRPTWAIEWNLGI